MTHCPHCGGVLDATPRPDASHRSFFAELHALYLTMPHGVTDRLNFDQFRKHALIKTGHRDESSHPCNSRAEAERLRRALVKHVSDYAVIFIDGATVVVWTAKSQSMRSMGKQAFTKSRDDVEAYARSLLGVSQEAA